MRNFITRGVKDPGATEMNAVEHQALGLFWGKIPPNWKALMLISFWGIWFTCCFTKKIKHSFFIRLKV